MLCSEQCVLGQKKEGSEGEVTISPLTSHNILNHRKKLLAGRAGDTVVFGWHKSKGKGLYRGERCSEICLPALA